MKGCVDLILALVLFLITYVLLLVLPNYRAYIALASAALFVILGIIPLNKVFFSVDWNVIMMIAGTMGIVSLFIESKMPSLLADMIITRMPNVKWAIISLSLFAGIISAFIDNVATVLMVAPVALTISKKLKISPVPGIIAISVSSNLQGAATLVGDTTSILLGGHANMDFLDFFFYRGKLGLFWIVQIGALMSILVLLWVFRKENQKVEVKERTVVEDYFPTILLVGTIVLLILASFIPEEKKPSITNGLICVGLMVVGLVRETARSRGFETVKKTFKEIDYFTLLLLGGLFIVISGITEAGVVDAISELFVKVSGDNVFLMYTLLVWASVFFSAFIDNIPYVATMLPVTGGIANLMGTDPTVLYFGLLAGATLGGNLTPIGASANITGLGILKKEGYNVSAKDFMKISVPFTLAAVTSGYVLIWLIWR
ncbi:arsenic transporter [Thermoclostridium stercorarium subsp. leptospartum DSM 9219]|jgi:Na+/H+ antiporter NhaD/arsenite permease-like protein|uniref:Arsenic transporter n=1 Tax=Thermoclostridium stercorarium subsp. leptospartum DSM 9219 TaxID=1346611 RepID=A0A1B1YIX1_THEST|nr:arsenic transporter [Thermoclostridium stercorarium subsp. leptospartum DSM 9219]